MHINCPGLYTYVDCILMALVLDRRIPDFFYVINSVNFLLFCRHTNHTQVKMSSKTKQIVKVGTHWAQNTSFNGMPHIANANHKARRAFWVLVVGVGCGKCHLLDPYFQGYNYLFGDVHLYHSAGR